MKLINKSIFFLPLLFLILHAENSSAGRWNKTYLQGSFGGDYKVASLRKKRSVLKAAHTSSWRYGENYFYVDAADLSHDDLVMYGEFDPSLSLSKMLNQEVGVGPIADILTTARFYADEIGAREYDYGMMWYWKCPKVFQYLSTKILYRKVIDVSGSALGLQLSSQINIHHCLFSTIFVDWTPTDQSKKEKRTKNVLATVALFGDIGRIFNKPYYTYLGTSFSYWRNKLGQEGIHERVLSAILRIYL